MVATDPQSRINAISETVERGLLDLAKAESTTEAMLAKLFAGEIDHDEAESSLEELAALYPLPGERDAG